MITYDVYINDAPLAGHTDLSEAQLLNIDRVLNTSYPAGTALKVQLMAKDGALTSLSDAVNLVVPVNNTINETFNVANGALDPTKWNVRVVGTTIATATANIFNNMLRMVVGSTATGATAAVQAEYLPTKFNFATQNRIKWKVPLSQGSTRLRQELLIHKDLAQGSTGQQTDMVYVMVDVNPSTLELAIQYFKKINNVASPVENTTHRTTLTQSDIDTNKILALDVDLTPDSFILYKDSVEIVRVNSGLGLTFNSGYVTLKSGTSATGYTVAGSEHSVYFDDLYFVNP